MNVLNDVGYLKMVSGQDEEATRLFEGSVANSTQNYEALPLYNLGVLAAKSHEWGKSLDLFLRARDISAKRAPHENECVRLLVPQFTDGCLGWQEEKDVELADIAREAEAAARQIMGSNSNQ